MGMEYSRQGDENEKNAYRIWEESPKERDHLEDVDIDERKILSWI
jgi:hypothetical protein